jgi:hypothetical protein
MAAGSVTVAALRSRPRQALLVAALSAVVTAAAALGPLYARAVEQSVVRHAVAVGAPRLVVADESTPVAAPGELAAALRLPPELGSPIGGSDAPVRVGDVGARLTAREDVCRHVRITDGRCPGAAGEVLVSRRTAQLLKTGSGRLLPLTGDRVSAKATVVGTYDSLDAADPYWAGRTTSTSDAEGRRVVDDLLTTPETLTATAWPELHSHLDVPLVAQRVDLRRLAGLRADLRDVDAQASRLGAFATSGIPALLDGTSSQRSSSRSVVLLLTVQLCVLGLVVLGFVGAAVTEQRRPEIALARLRGLGATGAGGMVLREVGLLLLAGAAAGTALAVAVGRLAALRWLEDGVPLEVGRPVLLAVVAAFVAGLLAVTAAAAPTLRQPLTSLLRRVPPRSSALRVGLVEGAVAAAAAAGVVTLLAGERGAVALLAPGLLAVAGGLLLSQLVVPVSARLGRRALRAGRVPSGLAYVQLARRPALRRLIAIVTVACALLVFAVDTWSVAARNRTTRSEVEAGAAVVLTTDAGDASTLRAAVLAADPEGTFATPVVTARSATEVGPRTLAVEPASFAGIAQWGPAGNRPDLRQLAPLTPETVDPVRLPAGTESLQVTVSFRSTPLPRPINFQGDPQGISLVVVFRRPNGNVEYVPFGVLRQGRGTYSGRLPCPDCTLAGFVIERRFGDSYPITWAATIEQVRAGATTVDLGPATDAAWQVLPSTGGPTTATIRPTLVLADAESTDSAEVRRGNVPAVTPALVAGAVPEPFRSSPDTRSDLAVAPDASGGDHLYAVVDRLRLVPRSGTRTVLTSLQALGGGGASGGRTTYEVWLGADDAGREKRLRDVLGERRLQVIGRDTTDAHRDAFGREGPPLALRLALLAGLVALLLAAAVLVVGIATSGTGRGRDLAGLRVVGTSAALLRRACVREHLVVALLGVLAGSGLGLLAAQAALPDLPVAATRSALLPVVLAPAWGPVAATVGLCLLLLCAVSIAVGRALAASGTPARLRETT